MEPSDKAYLSSAGDLLRLRDAFAAYDPANSGTISASAVGDALKLAGRDPSGAATLLDDSEPVDFELFLKLSAASFAPHAVDGGTSLSPGRGVDIGDGSILSGSRGVPLPLADVDAPIAASEDENADPKVAEFMRVLDEYRVKCEAEGGYDEAGKAAEQLGAVRRGEERRRVAAMRKRHENEREEIANAHDKQLADFNAAWDRYLAEFDAMASMYIAQMQERHAARYKEQQEALHQDILSRPVKFSRELLEWRTREQTLAKQRKYADAQRIKVLADELERRERRKLEDDRLSVICLKEAQFKEKQVQELSALVKRIEARRAEHVKQRDIDTKRLLQRNRNVIAVLEQRQYQEESKHIAALKAELHPMKHLSPKHVAAGLSAMRLEDDRSRVTPQLRQAPRGGTSPRTAAAISQKLGLTSPKSSPLSPLSKSVETTSLRGSSSRPMSSTPGARR